jgi:hypothetical protein
MLRYPGGDPFDLSSAGYAPTRNFLSDMGMTVAYNGQTNRFGASLFAASLLVLIAGVGTILVGLVRRYSRRPRSRSFARFAGAVGALACAAFVVVAFTPENRVMALHVQATLLAWRLVPVASAFLTLAALSADGLALRNTIVLAGLTAMLTAYVALLQWGPSTAARQGLQTNVIAQKVVALVSVCALVFLSLDAERGAETGSAAAIAK